MRLRELQDRFRDLLLGDYADLDQPPEDITGLVAANGIPASERLKVYRNNMIGSLTATLRNSFPVIDKLVGADFFDFMARHYILSHPPTAGHLALYGNNFDTFISQFKPVENLEYIYDTARFEIMLNAAYIAEDSKSMQTDNLKSISPELLPDIRIQFRDSLYLICSEWPLLQIRELCLTKDEQDALSIDKETTFLMIYRPVLDVEIVTLQEDEFIFLEYLNQNNTLGDSLEKTIQKFPGFEFQPCLHRHLHLGSFKSVIKPPRP